MAAAGLIALLAALYMMEVAVNDDEAVIIGSTQVIMITECSRVFQFVGDLSNYAMVSWCCLSCYYCYSELLHFCHIRGYL